MAKWHHEEMRQALEQRGWRIIAEYPDNGYAISGSWEIQRSSKLASLLIDFDGDPNAEVLSMENSYACQVRGFSSIGLYFRKQRSRHLWAEELTQFIAQLDTIQSQQSAPNVETIS